LSSPLELTDILEKDEVEMVYKREITEKEWENICYNLKTKFWSKIRKDMLAALDDAPQYFLQER
jgi:hypothetical protein